MGSIKECIRGPFNLTASFNKRKCICQYNQREYSNSINDNVSSCKYILYFK